MSNDLTLNKKTTSQPASFTQSVSQHGQKNTLIQHADKVIINNPSQTIPTIMPNQPLNPNTDYYNLIVDCMINLENPETSFSIDPSRALTEYIDADIKNRFASLSEDAVQSLQTFPTIFAHENEEYGIAAPNQQAGFGYILKIKVRHEGIIIKPSILWKFNQQILNENLLNFDIHGHEGFCELNRTHWTIKKVDLISEFRELGFQI